MFSFWKRMFLSCLLKRHLESRALRLQVHSIAIFSLTANAKTLGTLPRLTSIIHLKVLKTWKNAATWWWWFFYLGFYTGWLFPAAVVGVLVFLYGVFTMNSNTIAVETCHHGDQYLMCPLCETCDYWKLKDICLYKRIAYLFDHPGTVFYAIFMSFWGKNETFFSASKLLWVLA